MNFLHLNYFCAVAEEQSITKAARRLYISQQSLSNHMAKLEQELGVTLFHRSPSFSLTYAGERLYRLASDACALEKEIFLEAGDLSENRRSKLRIGISYTCGRALLPQILPTFCREHPLVEINLMEGNSSTLEEWLQQDMIDLMIAFTPISVVGAETFHLCPDRLFLVIPKTLLPQGTSVKADQLGDIPFISIKKGNRVRTMLDDFLMHRNIRPNVLLETENTETAFSLAEKELGCTFISELFLKHIHGREYNDPASPLLFVPVDAPETTSSLVLARMTKPYQPKAVEDFQALCMQVLRAQQ